MVLLHCNCAKEGPSQSNTSENDCVLTIQHSIVHYHPWDKTLFKAYGEHSLVSLPKIDELYTMLNGSNVNSSLDYTSGYHHITLLPEAQKKSAFMTLIGKFKFMKVPFGLGQAPAYFQQLINEVVKGLLFALDIWTLS